jgi:hypothetical protein
MVSLSSLFNRKRKMRGEDETSRKKGSGNKKKKDPKEREKEEMKGKIGSKKKRIGEKKITHLSLGRRGEEKVNKGQFWKNRRK